MAATNHAFTLIELLMVVMIIAVLFSILLSAIRTVERHTLQTVTQAEIKNIETAWKQYFAHYQMWPTNNPSAGFPENLLGEDLAKVLRGDADAANNPDRVVFMEFTRFAEFENEQIPVNAWGESGRHKPEDCAFYVMFDHDGDNQLEVAPGAGYAPTNILRSVAVWSFNPAQTEKAGGTGRDRPKLLGSWMQ
jgi:prepilin-type N-terminal cleavage/methylation domain-containing protein